MPDSLNTPATKADLEVLKADLVIMLEANRVGAFKDSREYINERTHDAETHLPGAFADYQQAPNTRFRHMRADLGNLNTATDERLAALEERVTNVGKRLIEKHI